jgi:hypothetical protein
MSRCSRHRPVLASPSTRNPAPSARSLALLRRPPPPDWLAAALGALAPSLRRLPPSARNGLIWSLSTLSASPGPAWLGEFMAAAFEGGLAEDEAACANVLFCVSALDMDFLAVGGAGWGDRLGRRRPRIGEVAGAESRGGFSDPPLAPSLRGALAPTPRRLLNSPLSRRCRLPPRPLHRAGWTHI